MNNEKVGPMPTRKSKELLAYAGNVATCLDGNAKCNNPNPPVNVLRGLIANLTKSEGEMGTGPGTTAQRNADRVALVKGLNNERDYVRTVAHQQATWAEAVQVIEGAGMFVRVSQTAQKDSFALTHGPVVGSIDLIARAVRKAVVYYWEISQDQKSWSELPDTPQARTRVTGLTPGVTYYFRFRALVRKSGMTDWSQALSLMAK